MVLEIGLEEFGQYAPRAPMRPAHGGIVVKVLVEKGPQLQIQRPPLGTVLHQRPGL
jgi:hypothetical protein